MRHSWQEIQAKLKYEQHLQEEADSSAVEDVTKLTNDICMTSTPLVMTSSSSPSVDSPVKMVIEIDTPKKNPVSHSILHPSHIQISPEHHGQNGGHAHIHVDIRTEDCSLSLPPHEDGFKDKRAAHYNEYKVLQALRHNLEEEDEDDDDEK